MEAIKSPDWGIVGILGAARGACGDAGAAVGTEHLLAGITTSKGPAREALAAEGATRTVLLAVVRERMDKDDVWRGDDDVAHDVLSKEVLGEDGDGRTSFTGAAARALTAAMEDARQEDAKKFGPAHLLRGLLAGDNRAVELLEACGISPRAVLARLDGDGDGDGVGQEDGLDLDPLLYATRDVLLGRSHYRRMPLWMRWLTKLSGINWASCPAGWVRQEAYEQARRLGDREVGTEHVLLAVLATHEVASRYPHLAKADAVDGDDRYAGGEWLARLGVDYVSVHRVLTAGDRVVLAADARPAEEYVDEATGQNLMSAAGTGQLVETLLREQTRARQLIDALSDSPMG